MNLTAEIFKSMNTTDGKPTKEMLERWKGNEMEYTTTPEKHCGKPDYEAMYHDICERYAGVSAENEELRANLREATTQNENLRAKLDMVYLIFGRNC